MKNILTTVATATLFTGLALSSAAAGVTSGKSILCLDGNSTSLTKDQNISIDVKNQGVDVNLTLIPAAVYQGASFKIKFENGGLSNNATHLLCVGTTKVGGLQEPGNLNGSVMVEPTFSFIDNDAVADVIAKDSNISFRTDSSCADETKLLTVMGLSTEACKTVSATITKGTSTQSNDIPSIVTKSVSLGKTIQYIKISCTAPECFITSDSMKFTENAAVAGVNVALSNATPTPPEHFINEASCPSCEKATITAVNTTPCVTYITIKNTAPITDDLNITGLDIVTTFVPSNGESATFTPSIKMFINEDNTTTPTTAVTLGTKISPSDLHIASGDTAVIKLALLSKNEDKISLGSLNATINGLDTNMTGEVGNISFAPTLVDIKKGATTDFTVPYMSAAGASQVNFVKVSTLLGAGSTTLSAIISDANGQSCPVTYTDIPANGGSTFIFASKVPASVGSQALIPTGDCSNLTSDLYSVKFSAGASVNAVSYMRTKRGERTIDIF